MSTLSFVTIIDGLARLIRGTIRTNSAPTGTPSDTIALLTATISREASTFAQFYFGIVGMDRNTPEGREVYNMMNNAVTLHILSGNVDGYDDIPGAWSESWQDEFDRAVDAIGDSARILRRSVGVDGGDW